MLIQNVKGGYDYIPQEQIIRNYINNTLKEVFEEYGYKPIETPILCYYDILSDKYDENNDILKEIYKLEDQGNRKLGLRYDLTVPFVKFIALNKNRITLPFKRYEINKVFRDGPVKIGRDREFTQCDVDVVGIEGQYIEAELLSLYNEAFKRLDIEIIIKYNNRKLMTGLILESKINENLVPNVTTILDKKDKLTEQELNKMLKELGLNDNQINNINKYFNMNIKEISIQFQNTKNETLKEGIKEINNLKKYLKGINIDNICKLDITLARGQNYYTGNVFEVYEKNGKLKGSIGGGGRYDNIVGNFINDGNIYPTVGISFGLTSIYELLKNEPIFNKKTLTDIYIIPIDTEIQSLEMANNLRTQGFKVEIEMNKKKIKKSLDYANKEKIPYVIVYGEDEIKDNIIKIKDMNNNKEITINDIKNIQKYIKSE